MKTEENPLFTLSIGDFVNLVRKTVKEILNKEITEKGDSNKENVNDDEHFSIAELCRFLRCSKVSIHKYKKNGLPFYRLGKKILFRKTEVLNFMKNNGAGKRRLLSIK